MVVLMIDEYVFADKNLLVNYLYNRLTNPTQIKVQKTLYLLYAFYGATYGQISTSKEKSDFEGQSYPRELFNANFEAWRYGPVDPEVYSNEKLGLYIANNHVSLPNDTSEEININEFCDNIIEQTNEIDDFSLVDRTHQDLIWLNNYQEGVNHIKMNGTDIIQEYVDRYVVQ